MIKLEKGEPKPTCGHPSSTRKTAMHCELAPGHNESVFKGLLPLEHYGRDRSGRWRVWVEK